MKKFNEVLILLFLLFLPSSLIWAQTYLDPRLNAIQSDINEGKCADAVEKSNELVQIEPEYYLVWIKKAYCETILPRYEDAYASYKKADALSSTTDTLLGLQFSALALGKNEESIEYGKKALEIDPVNYWAKLRLIYGYQRLEKYSAAEEEINNLQKLYGNSAELTWNKGVNRYYQGDKEEANEYFQKAYEMDPNHAGARYSLGLNSSPIQFHLRTDYGAINYSENSISSKGATRSLFLNTTLWDSWTIGIGGISDSFNSKASTSGIKRYTLDDYNVYYQALYLNTVDQLVEYYNGTYNKYQMYKLANSDSFLSISSGIGSIGYKTNDGKSFKVIGHKFSSNSSYVDGGTMVGFLMSFGQKDRFSFGTARIVFPKHNGYQVSTGFLWNVYDSIYLNSEIYAQTMNVQSYEVSLLYYYMYSRAVYNRNTYAAFQQSLSYYHKYFNVGVGGRAGNLYSPLFDEVGVYNAAKMKSGAFGWIGITPLPGFELRVSYAKDYWENGYGETPSSSQLKVYGYGSF
ncbi:MAG: tetratricopeptide repeat protein [Leptospiraceae bacterium]|nr:tetratricopeptide repeat protein [Leptospiraceae bacterium]MCP5511152.1 tetratricopeptide repeat protein [Leptospiraceae bacterium]